MNSWIILRGIDLIFFIPVALTTLYLLVFAVASLFGKNSEVSKSKKQLRFIVLIPAYKQDKNIIQTVNSILGQTYPQRMFDVTVISDHESEMTNMHLAQLPITLLTPDFEKSSKLKSLQYALLNLPEFKIYDCVVIVDGNNIVEPEFLEQINDAFNTAGTKVIQAHRVSRNRDTATARMDAIFEEINNSIFRRGHIALGLSSSITGSGTVYDFNWLKSNIMKIRNTGGDKELEAAIMRQDIFVDYFDDIHIYDEKTRSIKDFNKQRGLWAFTQFHTLINNIHYLPAAILNRNYGRIDKILQWMLVPRTIMMGIIMLMSIILPFIYFTLALKWWVVAAIAVFAFSLATPDYLVDENWDKTFLRAPLVTVGGLMNIMRVGKTEVDTRVDNVSRSVRKMLPKK